jgi:hopanoid biosynthesis associated radical SAM protein HpnH
MAIPISQMWTVSTYLLKKKLTGKKRFALTLMLEPLFRCSLACAGCGKVQYPPHILKRQLTPEECFAAADECGAPMVAIPGGEPLLHPQIVEIVNGLIARKKYVYMCTNALELKRRLPEFTPSKYLTFSVHLDGQREQHDFAVCREGTYDIAVEGIKEAVKRGFRVTTNATFFDGTDPKAVRRFFDEVMAMGVEGIILSPGYSYDKAPDQNHFMGRARIHRLFRAILSNRKPTWKFNMSPLFMEFLMGDRNYECSPWGMPTYNIFGWQRPCYLLQEGYAESFNELLETTAWENYGVASGNPKCANCMVSCGYETTANIDGFGTLKGFWGMARGNFRKYNDPSALKLLDEDVTSAPVALTQISENGRSLEEKNR